MTVCLQRILTICVVVVAVSGPTLLGLCLSVESAGGDSDNGYDESAALATAPLPHPAPQADVATINHSNHGSVGSAALLDVDRQNNDAGGANAPTATGTVTAAAAAATTTTTTIITPARPSPHDNSTYGNVERQQQEEGEEIEARVLVPAANSRSQGCRSYLGGIGRCVPYADCGVSFENEFLARSSLCGFSNRRPLVCCPHDTFGYGGGAGGAGPVGGVGGGQAGFQSHHPLQQHQQQQQPSSFFFPGFQSNFFQQNPFANSFFYTPAPTFYPQRPPPPPAQTPSYGYHQPSYGSGYNPAFNSPGFGQGGFNSNPYGYQPSPFIRPQQPSYQQQQPTFVGQLPSVNPVRPPPNQFGLPSSVRPPQTPLLPVVRNEEPSFQPEPHLNSPNCGLTNATTKRIVGGREAAVGAWPWLALLFVDVSGTGYKAPLCGGALINPTHILTAAHCVNLMGKVLPANRFTVRLGEHDYLATDDGANPVDIDVSRVFSHPDFNNRTYFNDIAILRLRRPVPYGHGIAPICVPASSGDDSEYKGRSASVAGWGELYYAGPASSILQEVTIPLQTLDTCKEAFKRTVIKFNEHYLCAGSLQGDRDTCRGDSGGPLMLLNDGRYTVIGVTSFGRRCAEKGYPGSYTRVAKYVDWLQHALTQA